MKMERIRKTSPLDTAEEGSSKSVKSIQPIESTASRSSEKNREKPGNQESSLTVTPNSYYHGGPSLVSHGYGDSLGARRRSAEQTSVSQSDDDKSSGVKRRSDGPKAAGKMLGDALSGMLAGMSTSLDCGPSPNISSLSPEKKKLKSTARPGDFFDALVSRDRIINFRSLDEGQIKAFLGRFNIEYDKEESFRYLQEKLFHYAREEIKKRVGADPDKYRVVLIQNNLPKAPKPSKSDKKVEAASSIATGDPPDPGEMTLSTCDVCNFEQKSNNQKLKKLSQDEIEAVKFIYKQEVGIQFLCQDHYKTTFKSFSGLNKKCSNPFGIPQHSSKNRLASLNIETVADIKRYLTLG